MRYETPMVWGHFLKMKLEIGMRQILFALFLAAYASASSAGTLTYVDPTCKSYDLFAVSSDQYNIRCTQRASASIDTPSCTLTASNTSIPVGGSVVIAPNCSPSAHTYSWLKASSAPLIGGAGGNVVFPAAGTYTYAVQGTNDAGVGPWSNVVKIDVGNTSTPSTTPKCTVTASTNRVIVGGSALVTATCTQSPTSYKWTNNSNAAPLPTGTGGSVRFDVIGRYTFKVAGVNSRGTGTDSNTVEIEVISGGAGTSCGTTPPWVTVIPSTGVDPFAQKSFQTAFTQNGTPFDSKVNAWQTKALEFINNTSMEGYFSILNSATNGSGYKDISISTCPGDYSSTLPPECKVFNVGSHNRNYSTIKAQWKDNLTPACLIPAGQKVYLNIRGVRGAGVGFMVKHYPNP